MPDIDAVERLLCERYNVRALDAGELTDALAQARKGSLVALTAVLDARDLYRWREPIYAALAEPVVAEKPKAKPAPEPEPEVSADVTEPESEPEVPAETPSPRGRRS